MGMTIAVLQEHIHERREQQLRVERVDLGQGFSIFPVNDVLFLAHDSEPGERAICGFVENTVLTTRWCLYREWAVELRETFGALPENMVVDGEV